MGNNEIGPENRFRSPPIFPEGEWSQTLFTFSGRVEVLSDIPNDSRDNIDIGSG